MKLPVQWQLILGNIVCLGVLASFLGFYLEYSRLTLTILLALAVTISTGFLVRILVARPLTRLAAISAKVAETGELNERFPVAGGAEIAALGRSLGKMLQSMAERIHKLSDDRLRLERLLVSMSQGVMILNRSGRISATYGSIREVLGMDVDLLGKTPLEVLRRPDLEKSFRIVLAGGPEQLLEIAAGNGRILQTNVVPVPSIKGDIDAVAVVFHDMTEVRRTEKMRRDFVANVSHEFKTPLTSIRGYAETLLSGAKDDPQVGTDFLRIIEKNAEHLQVLVSDLLTLAKLEAEMPTTRELLPIRDLVQEQIVPRKALIAGREINIVLDCPSIDVAADRSRLSTALSNLIDNAIHYNKRGGEIRISVALHNRTLRLVVADTGCGIPAQDLPRIFERFYRVDKARSRDSVRTGLGLSIVKHAIESQGGSVTVTSQLGVGSVFTILLPRADSAGDEHVASSNLLNVPG